MPRPPVIGPHEVPHLPPYLLTVRRGYQRTFDRSREEGLLRSDVWLWCLVGPGYKNIGMRVCSRQDFELYVGRAQFVSTREIVSFSRLWRKRSSNGEPVDKARMVHQQ